MELEGLGLFLKSIPCKYWQLFGIQGNPLQLFGVVGRISMEEDTVVEY